MTIPIFISTDKNYVIPAITLIASVADNTKENCSFFVLNSDLGADEQNYFQKCLKGFKNLSIEFISIDFSLFSKYPINRHFTHACYYRFLIPDLKPEIDKAIYLDVDMVVDFDIKELFDIDMDGKPIAAAHEKCMQYMTYHMEHCMYLGLDSKNYFNSGVLLYNLKYFRENNIVERLFECLEREKEDIKCPDQDILNLIFCDNYKKLDYKYNYNPCLKDLLKRYADPDYAEYDNIKIYHFAGAAKPWNAGILNREIWFKYADKVIPKTCLEKFSLKKNKQKILSITNEYTDNAKSKNLYVLGFKIPLYKREKTDKYTSKYILGYCYSKKQNSDDIKLIMTIVCKNEENIIEQHIRFHKEMGVDGFIVLNHNSTDNTTAILDKLKDEGIVLEIINKTEPKHQHSVWVEEMIKLAKDKYGATWVINSDADEFYFSKSLDLKESIRKSGDVNALMIYSKFLYPDDRKDFLSSPYFITRPFHEFEINLLNIDETSHWLSCCNFSCSKVIHKIDGFVKISDGNHDVEMKCKKMIVPSDISYYHYHIKNYDEYENKTKRWVDALEFTPKEMNLHLKRSLKLYNQGKLRDDYENKYGEKRRKALISQGVVSIDLSVYNFLKLKGII